MDETCRRGDEYSFYGTIARLDDEVKENPSAPCFKRDFKWVCEPLNIVSDAEGV